MFRKVFGLILLLLAGVLLFYPEIIKDMFRIMGVGENDRIFELETLMFISINFISYAFIFFLIYEGVKLLRSKAVNNN